MKVVTANVNFEKENSQNLDASLRYYVKLIWGSPTTEDTNFHRRKRSFHSLPKYVRKTCGCG